MSMKQEIKNLANKIFGSSEQKLGAGRKTTKLKADCRGWLQIGERGVNVVDEFKKLPNLNYRVEKYNDGYSTTTTVYVTNQVGGLVELYLQYDSEYASMPLSEFIQKTLTEALFSEPKGADKLD